MNMTWGKVAAVLAAAGALGVAGCGGSDGGGEDTAKAAKEMEAALVKSVTVNDPQVECVETVTKHFVATIYKSLATCKKAEAEKEDNPSTGATLTGVKVDGDTATGIAHMEGGDEDGASGELQFAKEDGTWKVDGLSAAYLKSSLTKSLSRPGDGPLADAGPRNCIRDGLLALPEAQFTSLAYDAISNRDNQTFIKIATECISKATSGDSSSGDENVSFLRKKFEEGIAESAKADGTSAAQIDCIVKELRKTITDDEILAQVGKKEAGAELTKKAAAAIIDCKAA